ncbi:hypothetical protein EON83_00030 [bacterium]|nr:MAG: hypothetical protein EON83_00030 [bacterium]
MTYSINSRTTALGNRTHVATTNNHSFYCALFEAALDVDIEPDTSKGRGSYTVEFICSDEECDAVLESALNCTTRGLVGVA